MKQVRTFNRVCPRCKSRGEHQATFVRPGASRMVLTCSFCGKQWRGKIVKKDKETA